MSEAPSTASRTLKIVLWIVLGLAALCALCCGGVLLVSDEAREGVRVAFRGVEFGKALRERYGAGMQVSQSVRSGGESVLAVGIPDFDPSKADEELDAVWRIFATSFAEGAPPVTAIAVGTPSPGSAQVVWKPEHSLSVEELARRTGVPVPPLLGAEPLAPAEPVPQPAEPEQPQEEGR